MWKNQSPLFDQRIHLATQQFEVTHDCCTSNHSTRCKLHAGMRNLLVAWVVTMLQAKTCEKTKVHTCTEQTTFALKNMKPHMIAAYPPVPHNAIYRLICVINLYYHYLQSWMWKPEKKTKSTFSPNKPLVHSILWPHTWLQHINAFTLIRAIAWYVQKACTMTSYKVISENLKKNKVHFFTKQTTCTLNTLTSSMIVAHQCLHIDAGYCEICAKSF